MMNDISYIHPHDRVAALQLPYNRMIVEAAFHQKDLQLGFKPKNGGFLIAAKI